MRRAASMISDRRFLLAFASTLLFATLMLVPASPAYASIADDVNAWLAGLLRDACNWMFTNQVAVLSSIGYEGIIGADFSQMLTTAGDVSMYDIARGVWDAAVLPIGCGVLGLVFTVKLIQISQRMDGNASFPGVKEVVFLLVFFAALTSVISLLEAVISTVCDQLKISRKLSVCIVGAGTALIGVLPSLGNGVLSNVSIMGYSILDFMDFITNSLLMPIGALLTCLFIGYVAGAKTVTDEVELSGVFKRKRMYEVMFRYIAPICLLAILVTFGVLPLLQ